MNEYTIDDYRKFIAELVADISDFDYLRKIYSLLYLWRRREWEERAGKEGWRA